MGLRLRRGVVRKARAGAEQQLLVELEGNAGGGVQPAIADTALVGDCLPGDEVIVNVQARELGLGSGGFDLVHVNLTRGLDRPGEPGAHVMKLNYTSLQHAVSPVEEGQLLPQGSLRAPVAVLALHSQLAPLAWSFAAAARARGGDRDPPRLGFVQTIGGALPGSHSRVVRELLDEGLLCGHVTAGACFGGQEESITTAGALLHGLGPAGWDAAVCGPGPGIIGSGPGVGHGGMAALDSAHAALALGASVLLVPRQSSADPRPRHQGLSHHSRSVLELLLAPVIVALPEDQPGLGSCDGSPGNHELRHGQSDLEGYLASGLPATSMGRDDELLFRTALAGGSVLAALLP